MASLIIGEFGDPRRVASPQLAEREGVHEEKGISAELEVG
jgi:hypothetical protein